MPLKLDLNAAAKFAGDFVLAGGRGADLQADGRGGTVEGLQTQDARPVDQSLGPRRVGAQFGGGGFESLHGFIQGDFRGEGDVDEGLRPVAAEIAHGANLTVGDGHQRSPSIAKDGAPQRQMLDTPGNVSKLDCIANRVLVLEDDIKTGDQIADEVLRAKADGDAGEAGEGEGGHRVNAYFFHGREQGDNPNNLAQCAVEDTGEGAGLLFANLRRAALCGGRLDDQPGYYAEKAVDEQRDKEDGYEVENAGQPEFRPVNGKTGHRFFGRESITLDEQRCSSVRGSFGEDGIPCEVGMSDTRRKFIALVAGAGTLAVLGAGGLDGQARQQPQPRPTPPDPTQDPNNPDALPEKSPTKAILEANDKDIKKNIEKLYQLATDLKSEVEKTDSTQVLSLTLVKKAEEIEKLAHDIKTRAKG